MQGADKCQPVAAAEIGDHGAGVRDAREICVGEVVANLNHIGAEPAGLTDRVVAVACIVDVKITGFPAGQGVIAKTALQRVGGSEAANVVISIRRLTRQNLRGGVRFIEDHTVIEVEERQTTGATGRDQRAAHQHALGKVDRLADGRDQQVAAVVIVLVEGDARELHFVRIVACHHQTVQTASLQIVDDVKAFAAAVLIDVEVVVAGDAVIAAQTVDETAVQSINNVVVIAVAKNNLTHARQPEVACGRKPHFVRRRHFDPHQIGRVWRAGDLAGRSVNGKTVSQGRAPARHRAERQDAAFGIIEERARVDGVHRVRVDVVGQRNLDLIRRREDRRQIDVKRGVEGREAAFAVAYINRDDLIAALVRRRCVCE